MVNIKEEIADSGRVVQARIKEKGARKGIYPYISLTAPLSFFPRRGAGCEVYTIG
jgi:hypothetical protein